MSAFLSIFRPDRTSVRALMALALAVLICEIALISPIVVASENRPVQQDSSETLTQLIQRLSSEAMAELRYLTTNYSPRQYFTEEEFAAAEYIEGKMRSLSGYAVTVQSFVLSDEHSRQVSRLSLVSPPARDVRSQVMEGSAMGDITAPVVAVGNALDTDIPDVGLSNYLKSPFPLRGKVRMGAGPSVERLALRQSMIVTTSFEIVS